MVSHYEPLPERDYRSEGKKLFELSKKVPRKKETQSEHDREEELKLNG